ncbi:hypothetical protein ACWHLZ_46470 [Streptomyces chartreusis]
MGIAVLLGAMSATMLNTGPAAASDSGWWYASGSAASGKFFDNYYGGYTDKVTACDNKTDGRGAVVYVYTDSGEFAGAVDDGGDPGCDSQKSSYRRGYYKIQVCLTDSRGTIESTCGSWHRFYNN